MATRDYTGRSVDLFVMQGAEESGMRLISPGFSSGGGEVTTGVQKAAQMFTVLFLTEKGTVAHDPEYGTNFLATARRSNAIDSMIKIAFREAVQDILDQQSRYRQTDDPDDELIASIELLGLASPDPTQMILTIYITTIAGTTREVILPVTLAVK